MARLIDADKLQVKHYLQRSEHPIGYEGTQAVYDYKDVLAYDIESAEIVEAIPIEWFKREIDWHFKTETYGAEVYQWVLNRWYEDKEDWKKENEKR